uniref:Disintegrin domain-containing protein n=1 Tax=Astyanax mexicanus TaxID=7994 RepID=A0A3B1J7C9_ASTMX
NSNPCCNPRTCTFTEGSQCAEGDCCENCQVQSYITKQHNLILISGRRCQVTSVVPVHSFSELV